MVKQIGRKLALTVFTFLTASSCGPRAAVCAQSKEALRPGADTLCSVPGFKGRDFILRLPRERPAGAPLPVVLMLHGGGGKKETSAMLTCPEGDVNSPDCLDGLADREGFAVVYPDGTQSAVGNFRTWNAGGGEGDWKCVSGKACAEGVDDLSYFRALLDELERSIEIDPKRVYATGLSNGAAMSHRLACELPDRIAAVAPVGGANQLAAVQGCNPSRPVSVLQLHGTEDPCWAYEGGPTGCLQDDGKSYVGVEASTQGWADRNGCGAPTTEALPDTADDGTSASRISYGGCRAGAEVVLIRIDGGGHTWPQGAPYFGEGTVGRVSRDFSANRLMWQFFQRNPRP